MRISSLMEPASCAVISVSVGVGHCVGFDDRRHGAHDHSNPQLSAGVSLVDSPRTSESNLSRGRPKWSA